ncbi:MAG: DUF992 domain-containing protein [Candidatus Thiodiazotropha sp.]
MKVSKKLINTLLGTAIALSLTTPTSASAGGGIQLGMLTCKSIPGTHRYFVVHHTVGIDCTFSHTQGQEHYKGIAGIALGLDLNWRETESMAYTVIGGSSDLDPAAYSLSGSYLGAQASVTVAVGASAAILVGGGTHNISLQPISLGVNTGLGAALGIGYLSLDPAFEKKVVRSGF